LIQNISTNKTKIPSLFIETIAPIQKLLLFKNLKVIAKKKGLKKIKASLYEMNIGSKKILEKNNFKLEGIMKSEIVYKGKRYKSYLFGKLL